MTKKIALHPKHPERICWGCDKYCAADSLSCGNGSERALHPIELFGADWLDWGLDAAEKPIESVAPSNAETKADPDAPTLIPAPLAIVPDAI